MYLPISLYYSKDRYTLTHVLITIYIDWYIIFLDYAYDKYYEFIYSISKLSKIEPLVLFYICGAYAYQAIFKDNKLHYFDANTHDEYYQFTVDSFICHTTTLQDHDHSLLM